MASKRLETFFGKVKKGLSERLSEIKPEYVAKFVAKEAVGAIPVVGRDEVDEIITRLEKDTIQLVLGEPASGKSIILKNIGFKLAKENKGVYVVELKNHSRDEVKCYFDDILSSNEKTVFIVDDAHLLFVDCERLVRDFKNRNSKSKLIIGSRSTREIRGEHPKETSEFEYLSKTEINAEDVTEEIIRRFLKRKYDFSDERIKMVLKNLGKFKKDMWHLSWALKAYKPGKDSVEYDGFYEKIRNSIEAISTGKDKPRMNAEDIIETEKIGRNRMLSLIHSSIADLYFRAYQAYPSLGKRIKEKILNQMEEDLQYCLFYKYMTSTDPRNAVDVVARLGRWDDFEWRTQEEEEVGAPLIKLIEAAKIQKSIEQGIEREEEIKEIGECMVTIAWLASKEVAQEIVNHINIDTLSSKIEKEEDIGKIRLCMRHIAWASEEVAREIVNRQNPKLREELQKRGY